MASQIRIDVNNTPFILSGASLVKEGETIKQDAGRTTPLKSYTLMGKIAAEAKWIPFDDETAEDGSAFVLGVYMGPEISAALLVAGDVTDSPILVGGGCTIDKQQIVIENSKTLATVVVAAENSPFVATVEDIISMRGIFVEATGDIDSFENQ